MGEPVRPNYQQQPQYPQQNYNRREEEVHIVVIDRNINNPYGARRGPARNCGCGETQTRAQCQTTSEQWLWCCLLTLPILIGCIPCCCFPFIIPSCYEYKIYCARCGEFLGISRSDF